MVTFLFILTAKNLLLLLYVQLYTMYSKIDNNYVVIFESLQKLYQQFYDIIQYKIFNRQKFAKPWFI